MIFLSYSSRNKLLAAETSSTLEAAFYGCFLAHDDIPPGDDWYPQIVAALNACHAFVGLLTDRFNESAACQQEVGAALILNKPSLLVRKSSIVPAGFAGRFQAARHAELIDTLDETPKFQALRIQAWIEGARKVSSYAQANALHDRFSKEWPAMDTNTRLQWLLAAASNSQVRDEGFRAGPHYKKARAALKPLLTDKWLLENDKASVLHDIDENPLGKKRRHFLAKKGLR